MYAMLVNITYSLPSPCRTERQWRDLAYCLRVMSFNERMIRTLQENLPIFAQQLSIQDVYNSFSEILTNAKKTAKVDFLPQLEEFEAKMEEVSPRENVGPCWNSD